MRLGILGGTFNPIHLGHLILAETARQECGLDRIVFVPAFRPPHKPPVRLALGAQRLALIRLGIRGHPAFRVSEVELRRGGVSYTIDTVRYLHKRYRTAKLFLIVGSDTLGIRWYGLEELRRLCTFVVADRGATRRAQRPGSVPLAMPRLELSSSMVRARVRRGQSIRYLVPDPVARYIVQHRLYRGGKE